MTKDNKDVHNIAVDAAVNLELLRATWFWGSRDS